MHLVARRLPNVLLICLQVVSVYLAVEIGYRFYRYHTAAQDLYRIYLSLGAPVRVFDPYSGFRYPPHIEGRMRPPMATVWKTNSHGHMSFEDYPVRKPEGEFRIAVVGDSFTAGTLNNVRWWQVLQGRLNESSEWQAAVGGKFTHVINFGIDGTGFEQYRGMVRHHAMPFEPDLIIVNFNVDDILRRLQYGPKPGSREERVKAIIKESFLSGIKWYDPCPLVFVTTIGSLWNMECAGIPADLAKFFWRRANELLRYPDRQQAIAVSAAAVRDIIAASRNILFLHHPMIHELEGSPVDMWNGLLQELQKAVPEWRFESMAAPMSAVLDGKRLKDRPELANLTAQQLAALPDERKPEIYRWFYLPDDTHYRDYGNEIYGGLVAKLLIDKHAHR